jgi:hypothetical protein
MLLKPENAFFVIADISGYTKFLAVAELEHAQDIIADFMGTMVESLRPLFRLAKFAVVSHKPRTLERAASHPLHYCASSTRPTTGSALTSCRPASRRRARPRDHPNEQ